MPALHHDAADAAGLALPQALTQKDEHPGAGGGRVLRGQAKTDSGDCRVPTLAEAIGFVVADVRELVRHLAKGGGSMCTQTASDGVSREGAL